MHERPNDDQPPAKRRRLSNNEEKETSQTTRKHQRSSSNEADSFQPSKRRRLSNIPSQEGLETAAQREEKWREDNTDNVFYAMSNPENITLDKILNGSDRAHVAVASGYWDIFKKDLEKGTYHASSFKDGVIIKQLLKDERFDLLSLCVKSGLVLSAQLFSILREVLGDIDNDESKEVDNSLLPLSIVLNNESTPRVAILDDLSKDDILSFPINIVFQKAVELVFGDESLQLSQWSDEEIKQLGNAFPHIIKLEINDINLRDVNVQTITNLGKAFPGLRQLHLCLWKDVTLITPQKIEALGETFSGIHRLILDCEEDLTDFSHDQFVAFKKKFGHVTELDLTNNNLSVVRATKLRDLREAFAQIRNLNLEFAFLSQMDGEQLEAFFGKSFTNVTKLNLSYNQPFTISESKLDMLGRVFPNVLDLTLQKHPTEEQIPVETLITLAQNFRKVTKLDLTAHELFSISNPDLTALIGIFPNVTNLNLTYNLLGRMTVEKIHTLGQVFNKVTVLNLNGNKLAEVPREHLEALVRAFPNLLQLDFSYNTLDLLTLENFENFLHVFRHVSIINLAHNDLTDEVIPVFKSALGNEDRFSDSMINQLLGLNENYLAQAVFDEFSEFCQLRSKNQYPFCSFFRINGNRSVEVIEGKEVAEGVEKNIGDIVDEYRPNISM